MLYLLLELCHPVLRLRGGAGESDGYGTIRGGIEYNSALYNKLVCQLIIKNVDCRILSNDDLENLCLTLYSDKTLSRKMQTKISSLNKFCKKYAIQLERDMDSKYLHNNSFIYLFIYLIFFVFNIAAIY